MEIPANSLLLQRLHSSIVSGSLDVRDKNGVRLPVDRGSFRYEVDTTGKRTYCIVMIKLFPEFLCSKFVRGFKG